MTLIDMYIEKMIAAGTQVSSEAANLEELIYTVTNIVNNLSSSWTDVAQTKFASQWNEVVPLFKAFVPELEAYSKAIIIAGKYIERMTEKPAEW